MNHSIYRVSIGMSESQGKKGELVIKLVTAFKLDLMLLRETRLCKSFRVVDRSVLSSAKLTCARTR